MPAECEDRRKFPGRGGGEIDRHSTLELGGGRRRGESSAMGDGERGGSGKYVKTSTAVREARRKVLGLGFWVQGFGIFPWMGVDFYLKDALKVAPSTLQVLHNFNSIPLVGKPLYGFLSDFVCIRGEYRLPYIAIGAFLQALSWLTLAILPSSTISLPIFTVLLILEGLGSSIAEVASDAIVAETGTQPLFSTISSLAGAVGTILSGLAVAHLSPRAMFFFFGFLLVIQFAETIEISESSLNLQNRNDKKKMKLKMKMKELLVVLSKPDIFFSVIWVGSSDAVIPILTRQMFYYHTQHLGLSPSVLSLTKFFAKASLLTWSMSYNRRLRQVPVRKLLCGLQGMIALFMLSDALFVRGFYRELGIPNGLYVVVFTGFQEALLLFKILPFRVMVARLCPPGYEGSVMAFLMSVLALAAIINGYLGVVLAEYFGVSSVDFSGLHKAILVEAACSLLPLLWSSWIPGDERRYVKGE